MTPRDQTAIFADPARSAAILLPRSTLLCASASLLHPVSNLCSQYRFRRAVCSPGAKLSRSLAVYSPLDSLQGVRRKNAPRAAGGTPIRHRREPKH